MPPLLHHRSTFAATLLANVVVLVVAAPRRLHLRSVARESELLQTEDGFADMRPAFNSQWFAEDADRMGQMPPFPPPRDKVCKPICTYSCGKSECDQKCEPLCLPPKCETICTKSADKCDTRCNKPKCAVICPLQPECPEDHACPKSKCRTICAPPACTTSCSGSCHSVCSQPQCTWKCQAGTCPEPKCKLNCPDIRKCQDKFQGEGKVPLMPGMDIKEEARASLDPSVLNEPVQAPPPPAPERLKQSHRESSIGYEGVNAMMKTPSPVKKLKMQWEAEDLHDENELIMRR